MVFRMPTKKKFFPIFCLFLSLDTFTSFFKDNKSFRSHKVTDMDLTDPEHWLHYIYFRIRKEGWNEERREERKEIKKGKKV